VYGDSDVIRKRADQLRDQGVDVRALADQLVATTEALGWTGRAATAMHERVTERATHLRAAAARHSSAADALDRHAREVDENADQIADIEQRFTALAEAGQVPAGFAAPPPGHKDWLTVDLP
jgi:hypothetical protein